MQISFTVWASADQFTLSLISFNFQTDHFMIFAILKGFWTIFGPGSPALQSLACDTMAQTVSQSACESNFSDFAYIVGEKRNRLNFSTQKKLVYLYSNLRLLK